MKTTYEGPSSGEGAKYAWSGNDEVGEGRMTIVESRSHELIRVKLEFLKPFAATNMAEFTFEPEGEQTKVEWAMTGQKGFVQKAMCLFMDMDAMLGADFEKGLGNLKGLSEAAAQERIAAEKAAEEAAKAAELAAADPAAADPTAALQ